MEKLKYIHIIEDIHEELMLTDLSNNIGLHSGTSGIVLFNVYYNLIIHQKNSIDQRSIDVLEHNIECINSGTCQHTICSGLSGFGWLCEHLKMLGVLGEKDVEFLDDIDFFLYKHMLSDIKEGNYDYLHGALGVATYFLYRLNKKEVFVYLEELFTELETSAELSGDNAIKWLSKLDFVNGEKGYSISLSHGISSIVAFLIRLYGLDFEKKRVIRLLVQALNYIIDQISFKKGNLSCFPYFSKETHCEYNSRLGWCYGDLGIAHILWQAAIVLKNEKWRKLSIKIFRYNTSRRDLQINKVYDAGICHGSSGIAYIFRNMFFNTGIPEFEQIANYWLDITIQMSNFSDGLAGFKAWRAGEYIVSDNMLTGIAGIGLVLLSCLNNNKTEWDKCLMLS